MAAAARQVVDNLDATMDRIPLTPMDQTLFNILREVQHLSETQRRELIGYLKRTTNEHEVPPHRAPANWISPSDGKGGTRRDTIRSKLQGEARRFASFLDRQASAKLNPAQLSRLYVLEVGFYGAVFANCYALGMSDLEPLMVEEGCSIFSINQDMGYHQSQLDVVRAKFKAITLDLRPSDAQLTIGHHPYLVWLSILLLPNSTLISLANPATKDVIPFKVFRENALKALELGPQALDEDQLCADFGAGGLVCWGSQQNSLGMEAGVPWDARSWEPQVWFLKKYRHLCGGWDDEMWMAARRWHSIRGETIRVN
jgi:hypothetical protein